MRKEAGIHRGRIDSGRISLLLRDFPDLEDIRIEGSLASGQGGLVILTLISAQRGLKIYQKSK